MNNIAERVMFAIEDVLGWIAEQIITAEMAAGDAARALMCRRLRRGVVWRRWAAEHGEEQADQWIMMHEIARVWLQGQKEARR